MTLQEKIRAHCTEDGDCVIWNGCLSGGVPTMRVAGKNMSVRRLVLEEARRWKDGRMAASSCGNRACIAEEHAIAGTRAQVSKLAAQHTGYHLNPVRNAKIAAYARSQPNGGKLKDKDMQAEILGSDLAQRVLAARYGVSQKSISQLKRGLSCRSDRHAFTGLGARA